jgi:hypothetical protein
LKRKKEGTSSESDEEKEVESISQSSLAQAGSSRVEIVENIPEDEVVCDNDLGKWVGRTSLMTTSQKLDKGCFFKFGVEVGVGESIESAPLV